MPDREVLQYGLSREEWKTSLRVGRKSRFSRGVGDRF
jgi:hypothetical protein